MNNLINIIVLFCVATMVLTADPRCAIAIVGMAEGFDEFKEEDLKEFQENLVHEERKEQLEKSDTLKDIIKEKEEEIEGESDKQDIDILTKEVEFLRKELLQLPRRDRFRAEANGMYQYDSNIKRGEIREEKGDSVFESDGTAIFDLGGKKTDLRFELGGGKLWNIMFSEKDEWNVRERLRYRRQYFKKLSQSWQSAVRRHNSKTTEIDENKIRWDLSTANAISYAFSPKLSLNTDFSVSKRLFRQEAFDQDSGWQVQFDPSAFWYATPKSRLSVGYSFGASRIRSKTGDSNSRSIRVNYFGKITEKSSASIDLTTQKQIPRSRDTAEVKTVTAGIGYMWQWTPKTQMTLQFTRSLQNSTSDLESGEVDGINTVTKKDTHFASDNAVISLNSRLTNKLSTGIALNGVHTRTTVETTGIEEQATRQFHFPLSVKINYNFSDWMRLSFDYTFSYRKGNERSDAHRAHIWTTRMNLSV